jgi:hypothetical protein
MVLIAERYTFKNANKRLSRKTAELPSHQKMASPEGWSDEISQVLQSLVIQMDEDQYEEPRVVYSIEDVAEWLKTVELISAKVRAHDMVFKPGWIEAFSLIELYLYGSK